MELKKYSVVFQVTATETIEVYASSEDDAIEIAEGDYIPDRTRLEDMETGSVIDIQELDTV